MSDLKARIEARKARWAKDRELGQALLDKYGFGEVACGFWARQGWLGIVEEAFQKLIAAGYDPKIGLGQVKQKFGELRIYLEPVPYPNREEWRAIQEEAREKSHAICEGCGKEREKKGLIVGQALCEACKVEEYGNE